MKARDERVALMNEVRWPLTYLRMMNGFVAGLIGFGWNPHAQGTSNVHLFLNTCPNIRNSLWLGNVVSRREFSISVKKSLNIKNSIILLRSCDFDFSYPPMSDEAFGNRLSGILFGWW